MSKVDYTGIVGDQRPRLSRLPEIDGTDGAAGIALSEMAGLRLDDWQAWLLDQLLGHRTDGATYWNEVHQEWMPKSSTYEAAIIVARQNGKGALLEALELAWLFLLGMGGTHSNPSSILHSAHESATAKEHFGRIEGLIKGSPELDAELAPGGIRIANGEWMVTLNTGQRLMFKTRTKNATRGFTIDKLVLDEAMTLSDEAVKAITYATSARPDPQHIYTGSVGNRESKQFARIRSKGIKGSDPRTLLAEWSADLCSSHCETGPNGAYICRVHDNRADPMTWFKANPGLGKRLQLENVNSEFGGSAEAFDQERLTVGDWPMEEESWAVITKQAWLDCLDSTSRPIPPMTFAIDTTPDKRWTAIVAAASNGAGNIHVEVTGKEDFKDYRPGTSWVVDRAIEINRRSRNCQWIINKSTQSGAYWDELVKAGLTLITPTENEYAKSCGDFFASIMPIGGSVPDIRHVNQDELRNSVANAAKRDLAEVWAWDKKGATGDISCLVAATLAVWGHRKRANKPKPKPRAAWV